MRLQNQIAIVTGAGRNIGEDMAKLFVQEGAKVAVVDLDQGRGSRVAGDINASKPGAAISVVCDVASPDSVEKMVQTVVKQFGGVDILVNNAGITRDTLVLRMKEEDWQQVLQVNLSGMYHCSKAAIRPMIRQRYGRIINITSIVGIIGNAGQVNYAAAKAGAIGLTKALAREVASRGITVNAVAPGFIETEMTQELSAQAKADLVRQIPLGRWGTPQDVADCVSFLVSSRASYITGQVIQVNGGLSM